MVVPWGGTQTPRVFKNPWGLAGSLDFAVVVFGALFDEVDFFWREVEEFVDVGVELGFMFLFFDFVL